jgi:hypothetical protein
VNLQQQSDQKQKDHQQQGLKNQVSEQEPDPLIF